MNQGLIILVILCATAIILGIDAIKWHTKEMQELRKNHPERFDEKGRFMMGRKNTPTDALARWRDEFRPIHIFVKSLYHIHNIT